MTTTSQHKFNKTIHLFRRDYRIVDNTALISASKQSREIIPVFIFTYKQIRDNPFKSDNCVQFLCESLIELNDVLKSHNTRLYIFYGDELDILTKIFKEYTDIDAVSFNMDYTLYSKERDAKIIDLCNSYSKTPIIDEDITLHPLGSIMTTTNKVYTKYTPYYRKSISTPVKHPDTFKVSNFINHTFTFRGLKEYPISDIHKFYVKNIHLPHKGGRNEALKILNNINSWKDYNARRNELDYETTRLSPYNKFGCISVREAFYNIKNKLGINSGLISQYIWRDFFYTLSYYNPEIYKKSLNLKFRNIHWSHNKEHLQLWKDGKTGFPIVDACMTELNKTGYMHNRGRLIVSNFLVRLLLINWQEGEYYFAKQLYDYDPAQNNFGWQISAHTSGTESRPLSQTIMNPWIQSHNFDPDASYIKKWLPHLNSVSSSHLHQWDKYYSNYDLDQLNYYKPIISYEDQKKTSIQLYMKAYQ